MKTIKLKLNTPMVGYEAGREVTIQTDDAGVPLVKFWRRRLKDADTDKCVQIIKPSVPKKERNK